MYIFAVSGLSKTGKTTVVEAMVRSYSTKGFNVATIKNSACKNLTVENSGTDTARHREAGAVATILRSPDITAIVRKKQLSLEELLIGIDYDVVILEGFGALDIPKIVTAASFVDADTKYTPNTFAFSGKLAASAVSYRSLPVINCVEDTDRLTELALDMAWRDPFMIAGRSGGVY